MPSAAGAAEICRLDQEGIRLLSVSSRRSLSRAAAYLFPAVFLFPSHLTPLALLCFGISSGRGHCGPESAVDPYCSLFRQR